MSDPDSMCGALALQQAIKCDIILPDLMTGTSKSILSFLKIKPNFSKKPLDNYKTIIIIDTNTYGLLGKIGDELKKFKGKIIIIDHHSQRKDTIKTDYKFINKEYPSTCQYIYKIIPKIDKTIASLLLFGMISDSANFKNVNAETFGILSKLLKKSELNWEEIISIFDENRNFSNKLINLNAVKDCKAYQYGTILLTSSIVPTFEGHVAESLVDFGSDISFVGAISKHETRISARMHPSISNIHLDEIMQKLGEAKKGTGGGHRCAAGANLPCMTKKCLSDFLNECILETIASIKNAKLVKGKIKQLF